MKRSNLLIGLALSAVLAAGALAPALAATETQTIDATLGSSVTMSLSDPTVSWTLASSGTNTKSAGSLSVGSNAPYSVTVIAEKPTLTEWDGSAYGTKALATPLSVLGTLSSGTGTPAGGPVTNAAPTAFATGVGLGTDVYGISLSQATTLADPALPTGSTYHNVLSYTASATI